MQPIKRDLGIGLTMSALLFAGALAWGSPFVSAGSGSNAVQAQEPQTQSQPSQAQPDQAQPQTSKSNTFTGTVIKSGSEFALRDSSGQVFKLDNSETAKQYEGKSVKITGQLDEMAKLIHVVSIEGLAA